MNFEKLDKYDIGSTNLIMWFVFWFKMYAPHHNIILHLFSKSWSGEERQIYSNITNHHPLKFRLPWSKKLPGKQFGIRAANNNYR